MPLQNFRHSPVRTSHTFTVWSELLLASISPEGLKVTERYQLLCPLQVKSSLPLVASHKRTTPLLSPVAKSLPSGLNATDKTVTQDFSKNRISQIRLSKIDTAQLALVKSAPKSQHGRDLCLRSHPYQPSPAASPHSPRHNPPHLQFCPVSLPEFQ
jgi:hypothetical protein